MLLALGPPFENHCVRERRGCKQDQLERNGHKMKGDEGTGLRDPSVGRRTYMVVRGDVAPRGGEGEQRRALRLDLLKPKGHKGEAVQGRKLELGCEAGLLCPGNKARSQTSG